MYKVAKIVGMTAIAVIAGTMVASAADLRRAPPPVYVPPPPPPSYVYNWTGLYVGLNGAYGWGDSDAEFTAPAFLVNNPDDPALDIDLKGAMVGPTIGYNVQLGTLVLGIEGDYDWGKISGVGNEDPALFGVGPTIGEFDIDWLATLRGRVGVTMPGLMGGDTLLYVTGGAAWAGGHRWIENNIVTPANFNDATHTGWTVGGGFEYAINAKWSVKAEYLYIDLRSKDYNDATSTVVTNVHPIVQEARFGINVKLF